MANANIKPGYRCFVYLIGGFMSHFQKLIDDVQNGKQKLSEEVLMLGIRDLMAMGKELKGEIDTLRNHVSHLVPVPSSYQSKPVEQP